MPLKLAVGRYVNEQTVVVNSILNFQGKSSVAVCAVGPYCWCRLPVAIHKWCLRQWIYCHLRAGQGRDPFNTLRNKQNGFHFADNIFKWTFLKENIYILIEVSIRSTIHFALLVLKWKYYTRIKSTPWLLMLLVNTLRMMQKGSHFADSIFKFDFLIKIVIFWLELHWYMFPTVWLIIIQY